jgi:tetratricopeptide (TPR) repeat protein
MLTDLAVTPISETIYRLAAERRSGDLQVNAGAASKMVFFDHGRIVFAASNLKEDRLGEALLDLGRITDEEFARASGLMQADRKLRFGDALVQAGVMDKNAVGMSVAAQVSKIVLSLFRLDVGSATFEERPCTIPLEFMVGVPVQRLLLSGINTMGNAGLVQAGIGNLDRPVQVAPVPPFTFKAEKCTASQKEVLAQASSGPLPIRRLASGAKGVTLGRLRAVYALLASGILEEASSSAAEARPQVQSEARGFLLSNLQRKPDPQAARPAPVPEVADEPAIELEPIAEEDPAPPEPPVASAPPEPTAAPAQSAPSEPQAPAESAAQPVSPEVERLLTQATVCANLSDHAGALQAWSKIVELAPDVAAHRVQLAVLMTRWPQTLRQAERHFMEALRLDPNDAETHYQYGLYYRKVKIHSRAIAEFRTALRLDAHHPKARAELAAASPDDNVFTSLKKLLG